MSKRKPSPYSNHVVVNLLQLLLRDIQRVRGRVELVGLETLIGETDFKVFVIFL